MTVTRAPAAGQNVLGMPMRCHRAGHQYIATVLGLLFCFVWGLVLELLLIREGSKASPCRLQQHPLVLLIH